MRKPILIWLTAFTLGIGITFWISSPESAQRSSASDVRPVSAQIHRPDAKSERNSTSRSSARLRAAENRDPATGNGLAAAPSLTERDHLIEKSARGFRKEYRRFLAKTSLDNAQQELLMKLCGERSILLDERVEGIRSGRFRTTMEADTFYRLQNQRIDSAMRSLLGNEYSEYWTETEKIPIMRQVDIYAQIAARHEGPLDQEQRDMLVDIYWEHYNAAEIDMFFSPTYSSVPSGKEFVNQMTKRSYADLAVRESASAFLTQPQLERLKRFQSNQITGMFERSKLPQKEAN